MVKVKRDEHGVDGSVDVWAAITSGEKYQDSNLPLLRISAKVKWLEERQGFTKSMEKMIAGCNKILDQTSTRKVFLYSNYGCLTGSSVKTLPLTRVCLISLLCNVFAKQASYINLNMILFSCRNKSSWYRGMRIL